MRNPQTGSPAAAPVVRSEHSQRRDAAELRQLLRLAAQTPLAVVAADVVAAGAAELRLQRRRLRPLRHIQRRRR
jgi:hypothetical protein